MSILDDLSIQAVVNAAGTFTRFGGCRIRPEATAAMCEVAGAYLDIDALQKAIGNTIAKRLRVEAAAPTAGASAGLALCVAAAIAGTDPKARRSLPVATARREVIVPTSHRNPYDHAIRISGGLIIEAGDAIASDGNDIAEAIGPNTAAVVYFLQAAILDSSPHLMEVLDAAHQHDVPVIVDAAAELPPKHNLWLIAQDGADMVVFSGGKHLGGPPASGLVVGAKQWIDKIEYHAVPNYGVGRVMKPGKDALVGLLAALLAYLDEDEESLQREWARRADVLCRELKDHGIGEVEIFLPTQPRVQPASVPRLRWTLRDDRFAETVQREALKAQRPVAIDRWHEHLILNVQTLRDEEIATVVTTLVPLVTADMRVLS